MQRAPTHGIVPWRYSQVTSGFPTICGTRKGATVRNRKGNAMQLKEILTLKGSNVVTVGGEVMIAAIVSTMKAHRIGAVVVLDGMGQVDGIVTETDIIHVLSDQGAAALTLRAKAIAKAPIVVSDPNISVQDAMRLMTSRRVRHLVLNEDGALSGIVSIGDIVKSRLENAEMENRVLRDVASARLVADRLN